ncbi:MAG: c-type cytochrome [Polyangiaceae bacterium]|jgi:mono/diheme cytochrome c family protein
MIVAAGAKELCKGTAQHDRPAIGPSCLAFVVWVATACGVAAMGASDAQLARGRAATSFGAQLFAGECARCHGRHGEGFADGPAILGPRALPEYAREAPASGIPGVYDPQELQIEAQTRRTRPPMRDPFRSAQDLLVFLSTHLPKKRIAKMKEDGLLSVVAFMLAVQGADLPAAGLTLDDASSVAIPRR